MIFIDKFEKNCSEELLDLNKKPILRGRRTPLKPSEEDICPTEYNQHIGNGTLKTDQKTEKWVNPAILA